MGVPLYTKKWSPWPPPQYRGFDASPPRWNRKYQVAGQSSDEQPTADFRQWLMKYDGNLPEFDLFSSRRWLTGSMTTDAKEELALCSIRLLKLLDDPVLWQRLRQQAIANDPQESASRDLSSPNTAESVFSPTWGELFASRILSDTIARDDDTQTNTRSLTVLMDRDSLAQIGIFPSRPVFPVTPVDGNPTRHDKGLALLERNRLAVIFDGNHNMLVTSAQAAATLRLQLIPVHANRFWYYPQGDIAGVVSSKNTTHSTVFVLPSQWQSHAHENQHPFRFFDAFVPPGVDMPGWVVHDVVCDSDFPPSIQLVRHDTLLTCQLFVFFSIVLVSCRIRPVPMIRVIVPSVAVILLIRFLPPCFSCLVPSAFWGVVCVFALGLIRLMHSNHGKTPQSTESDRSTVIAARDLHDDSEPGEVRHVPPSPTTPDTRQDSGEIPGTETGSSSRHAILTLLVVSAIILFITTKPLSAQPSTFPGVVPATPSPNPLPAEITPETPGNIPETIRGIPDDSNDPPPPCQVYIPYDSQGRIGDRFFLPGPLLNDLPLSWSGKEVASSGHWRICKAHYAGTLTQDPIQNEVTLSNFRVVYDVEIDGASAVVRLPAMPIAPDGIQCDNRLIQPVATGETNRKEYAFTISGQGRHRLEVTLMPTIHDKEDLTLRHFDFPIPPVPDSTLELLLPAANFPVEISPSLGQLSHPSDKLRASLGPAKQLSISWPIRSSFPVNMTVSQYFRFHVASDQVKLHIRFRFNIPSGSIRQVQIMIDPRYKRDGEWRASEAIESSEPVTGMENLRRITFQNPVSKSVTVELDCIPKNISGFADFSGIGTLALPRFRADDTHAQINHSWLGVFSTPSVEIELPLSNVETRIFENAWGRVNEPVQYAYDLLRPPENWFLTVKSRPVRKQINQRQWLLFRNQSILACLEEDVTPFHDGAAFPATDISPSYPAISSFSHEMILPEGFRCETAEVKSDSGQRLIKTRLEQNDRKLLLFFKEPVSGKYTVTLTGTVACEFHTEIPFPLFTHDDQEIVQRSVFCFRETSILVEQSLEEQSVQPIEAIPSPMPSVSPAYFISAYRIESLEQFLPSTIVISPNKPEITGVMVSRLERVFPFTHWNMNISWDVTISHGELDQVSLFIPVLLGETMVVASQPIITVVQTTKKDGTLVELRSRVPLSGKQSFEIRFPIGGTFDTVSVPNVRFLHDSELEHYVALPNYVTLPESSGYKPLTWTLANLSLSDYVPPTRPSFQYSDNTESSSRIDVASIYRYYRAGQRDFVANTGYSHDAAFVSCHSVTCFVRLNGICFVVSEFDIQGSDSSHCEIAFPHEYLLIRLQLNDVFPLPQRVDDATLRVELLSDVPVQRLKLFYCSRQAISGRDQTHFSAIHGFSNEPQSRPLSFPLPQVLSLPVHKTLWEVFFEPLPTTDKQIDTFVNVSDGHKRSSTHKKMVALEQPEAGGLRVRMELARLSWSLAFFRLTSAQPQEESKFSGRQAAWSRLWDGTQRKVHRFLPEWNQNRDQWDESFLFSEPVDLSDSEVFNPEPEPLEADADMAFAEACFSRKKTPQTLYDEIVNQYTALTTGSSLPSLPVDQESNVEAQTDMEHDLDWAYFWDEPVKVRYLAGVTPYGMTDLTLVFHPQITTVPRGVYLHYAFWGTVCLAVLVLAVSQRTQQLFRQFSSLFVIALIVFCWLFVKPNLMGWAVLLIMLISAIRIQWNRMRAATTVVMQNVVDQ
ncbi:MAG: hypothetical protein FWH27_10600 [Planctomycetaceae bacterium]|nr:hypothetical protein [Planctomycetaceae bacterium]